MCDAIGFSGASEGCIAVFQLILAGILTGVSGMNRRKKAQPAGLRTHIIISMGACLVMQISLAVATLVPNHPGDPGRIAAQVVTGIGFLGAGAILRIGYSVRGLTTASSVWMCAAIGLAIGAGMYVQGIAGGVLLFLTLAVLNHLENIMITKTQLCKLQVDSTGGEDQIRRILGIIGSHKIHPNRVGVSRNIKENKVKVITYLTPKSDDMFMQIEMDLSKLKGVEKISWNRD